MSKALNPVKIQSIVYKKLAKRSHLSFLVPVSLNSCARNRMTTFRAGTRTRTRTRASHFCQPSACHKLSERAPAAATDTSDREACSHRHFGERSPGTKTPGRSLERTEQPCPTDSAEKLKRGKERKCLWLPDNGVPPESRAPRVDFQLSETETHTAGE